MAETYPDVIVIHETEYEEVPAKDVSLFVSIQGSSFFVGDAALEKAREVKALVSALVAGGLRESDIQLLNVRANVSTGMLGRNSSANYELRVLCQQIETLPDVLGVLATQKNTKISHMRCGYGDTREIQLRLLDVCIERAGMRGQRIAKGLGTQILGVHKYKDSIQHIEPSFKESVAIYGSLRETDSVRYRRIPVDEMPDLTHQMRIIAEIEVEYRVAETFIGASRE